MRLLVASSNAHKLREIGELCAPHGIGVVSPADLAREGLPALPIVDETGSTFRENALLKAVAAHVATGLDVLADDSGLCVNALDGAPGVHSARFAGPGADDAANRSLLLQRMTDVADGQRQAAFQCELVLVGALAEGPGCGRTDGGHAWRAFQGRCEGEILTAERGFDGFGYDSLFWHPGLEKTFAEADSAQKHAVSHRGLAFVRLQAYLANLQHARQTPKRPLYLRHSGLEALARALAGDIGRGFRHADQALEHALHADPSLGPKEREAVAELHWVALRNLASLLLALRALKGAKGSDAMPSLAEVTHRDAAPLAELVLHGLDPMGGPLDRRSKAPLLSALDGLVQRNARLQLPEPPPRAEKALRAAAFHIDTLPELPQLAIRLGVHPDLLAALQRDLGADHATAALTYLNQRAPLCVRANALHCDRERLRAELRQARVPVADVAGLPDALLCLEPARLTLLLAFHQGAFEVQDEGSQRIAQAVDAKPGETVLDWCAGAGGKTLALAAAMRNHGKLIALDTHGKRLDECQRRLQRAGVTCATTGLLKPGRVPADMPLADAVLVDAPCTSTGALRRNPELRWHVDADWLGRFPAQQLDILRAAAKRVKPGGRLVYATCSLLRVENEAVVRDFLGAAAAFELVREERIGPASAEYLATFPLASLGPDGFYFAVLRRRAAN
jgi:16S rRNA (cytosine967-C5)-methyltransferase